MEIYPARVCCGGSEVGSRGQLPHKRQRALPHEEVHQQIASSWPTPILLSFAVLVSCLSTPTLAAVRSDHSRRLAHVLAPCCANKIRLISTSAVDPAERRPAPLEAPTITEKSQR